MIFSVDRHIEMIREGTKTQTRRLNRGIYQIGKDYAVQRKRGIKAEPDMRIVMNRIWEEIIERPLKIGKNPSFNIISEADALAEGGYTPEEFERVFRELNPKWDGWSRWAFEFHVEVSK